MWPWMKRKLRSYIPIPPSPTTLTPPAPVWASEVMLSRDWIPQLKRGACDDPCATSVILSGDAARSLARDPEIVVRLARPYSHWGIALPSRYDDLEGLGLLTWSIGNNARLDFSDHGESLYGQRALLALIVHMLRRREIRERY